MSYHTAIANTAIGQIEAIQVPTGTPNEGEVLIKVEYAALMAVDIYQTDRGAFVEEYPQVLGCNVSGTIAQVGRGAPGLKVGDRVTAFTMGKSRSKATQQYTIQHYSTVAKVPSNVTVVEAAAVPNAFVTAFYTLFDQIGLPVPRSFPVTEAPPLSSTPILVYGGGSSSGQYVTRLLHIAGYNNVVVMASPRHHEDLCSLGATHTIDYNSPTLAEDVFAITGDAKFTLGVDCIATVDTLNTISKIFSPSGKLAILLPIKEANNISGGSDEKLLVDIPDNLNPFPDTVDYALVRTFSYRNDPFLRENLMPRLLPELLASGAIQPSNVRLLDQGSFKDRVALGLELLRNNNKGGEKLVVKVEG